MKITLLTPALAAVLGLALASAPVTVQAQSTNAAPAVASATSTKKIPYKGEITTLDASSVTVKGAKTLTLAITADTKFGLKDGKTLDPAAATDFAVGDKVTGSYIKNADGTLTAASVHKKKPAAK